MNRLFEGNEWQYHYLIYLILLIDIIPSLDEFFHIFKFSTFRSTCKSGHLLKESQRIINILILIVNVTRNQYFFLSFNKFNDFHNVTIDVNNHQFYPGDLTAAGCLLACWVGWVRWLTCCCCWLFAGCSSLLVFLVWLLENFSWNKFWRCKIPEVLENFQQDIFLFIFDGGRITHTYYCVKDERFFLHN